MTRKRKARHMNKVNSQHSIQLNNYLSIDNFYEESLFFDIETTGFSPKNSFIYLIGAATFSNGTYTIHQWLAANQEEECQILDEFISFIGNYKRIIHFNGNRFDIPFVEARCLKHNISCRIHELESLDIYRDIYPYKNILKLINLKQKSIEEFLNIHRDDMYDGGKLIKVYHEYVKSGDEELKNLLLLHNHDDMLGLAKIFIIEYYVWLLSGNTCVIPEDIVINDKYELIYRINIPYDLPGRLSYGTEFFYIILENNNLKLCVKGIHDELKHFYEDYKNYYYLPDEDYAIHKRIAAYVDKSHRVKASRDNCYVKRESTFMPQASPIFLPAYGYDSCSSMAYFEYTDELMNDMEFHKTYIRNILTWLV